MSLQNRIGRLEQQAREDANVCPHLPPLIQHADGRLENESSHSCGRPRLVITVSYSDGSDQRTQKAARAACLEIQRKFGLENQQAAEIIAEHFPVSTRALVEQTA